MWRVKDDLLRGVDGIGPLVSITLLAELPEPGAVGRRHRSQPWPGWPLNCDGGLLRGKRRVSGGRAQVRAALYMAILTATRYNPGIKVFYQRLLGLER